MSQAEDDEVLIARFEAAVARLASDPGRLRGYREEAAFLAEADPAVEDRGRIRTVG